MKKSKLTGWDSKKLAIEMMKTFVAEQNIRLVAYAQKKIVEIGGKIQSYHRANNMDRTGNLLDSLLWGVSYQGKLIDGGFFREAQATSTSYLHEWMSGDVKNLIPVYGRKLAKDYLDSYGNNGAQGWKVFFAILAPYWGYWEEGFRMNAGFAPKGSGKAYSRGVRSFYKFAVMTEFYDEIKKDLKPARVRFRVSVAKYDKTKLEKRWKRYAGIGD